MIEPHKSKAQLSCKKALGTLNKVLTMIEGDSYCMDILQQIRAVEGLLASASAQVLESHLNTCVGKAYESKTKGEVNKTINELLKAFKASKK